MSSSTTLKIGADHPFPFPKIKGFLSENNLAETIEQLRDNKVWNLSEKLDGCNVSVSTNGWFASRNKIVDDCRNKMITRRVWNNAPLRHVPTVYRHALQLKLVLARLFQRVATLHVMLYGELLLSGVSTSHFDVYNYARRNFEPGQIYVFAIGLVLPANTKLPFFLRHGIKVESAEAAAAGMEHYVIPINSHVSELLDELEITHIRPVVIDRLATLLTSSEMVNLLLNRKKEGLVLSGNNGEGFIKWKYNNATALKEQLTLSANQLIDTQEADSESRRAAENIKRVYESGLDYINKSEKIDHEALFEAHMTQNKEKWDDILEEATKQGNFYLTMAMLELESEVMRDIVWNLKMKENKQLDPKVKLELKSRIVEMVENWCREYTKICKDESSPDSLCTCH